MRTFIVSIVVSVSLLLVAACKPTEVKEVLLIGDSISEQSSGSVVWVGDDVDNDDPVHRMLYTVLATGGIGATSTKKYGYWEVLLPNVVEDGEYDSIVIELGTNDCNPLVNYGDYVPLAQNILDSIRSKDANVPIFWLTMQDVPGKPTCADIVNNDIAALVPTLPYREWAMANPQCFSDGVHLREGWRKDVATGGTGLDAPVGYCDGEVAYAKWLKEQLDNYFGPRVKGQ